jgi:hypothetical protein
MHLCKDLIQGRTVVLCLHKPCDHLEVSFCTPARHMCCAALVRTVAAAAAAAAASGSSMCIVDAVLAYQTVAASDFQLILLVSCPCHLLTDMACTSPVANWQCLHAQCVLLLKNM